MFQHERYGGLVRREVGGGGAGGSSKRERSNRGGLMMPPGGTGAADPEMLMELEHGPGAMMQPGRGEKVVHQDAWLRFDGGDLDPKNLD